MECLADPFMIQRTKGLLDWMRSQEDLTEEEMILEALEDVKHGRVHTNEEVEKEIARWIREGVGFSGVTEH